MNRTEDSHEKEGHLRQKAEVHSVASNRKNHDIGSPVQFNEGISSPKTLSVWLNFSLRGDRFHFRTPSFPRGKKCNDRGKKNKNKTNYFLVFLKMGGNVVDLGSLPFPTRKNKGGAGNERRTKQTTSSARTSHGRSSLPKSKSEKTQTRI